MFLVIWHLITKSFYFLPHLNLQLEILLQLFSFLKLMLKVLLHSTISEKTNLRQKMRWTEKITRRKFTITIWLLVQYSDHGKVPFILYETVLPLENRTRKRMVPTIWLFELITSGNQMSPDIRCPVFEWSLFLECVKT